MKRPYWICSWRMAPLCLLDILGTWLVKRHSHAVAQRYDDDMTEEEFDRAIERAQRVTLVGRHGAILGGGRMAPMVDPYELARRMTVSTSTGAPSKVTWRTH